MCYIHTWGALLRARRTLAIEAICEDDGVDVDESKINSRFSMHYLISGVVDGSFRKAEEARIKATRT